MSVNLIQVPFHGDVIEAAQDERGVWAVVKRCCESLGLQPHRQAQKLKEKPWAVTHMMCATGPDGKQYEMLCIHLDSLPLWLATISINKVKPEMRDKLTCYQKEAARVLADHFFGRKQLQAASPAAIPSPEQWAAMTAAAVREVMREMESHRLHDLVLVEDRIEQRWPQATKKNRRRVRDLAVGLLWRREGKWPMKVGHRKNSQIAFERDDLAILDEAIDKAMEEVRGPGTATLFQRAAAVEN